MAMLDNDRVINRNIMELFMVDFPATLWVFFELKIYSLIGFVIGI